MDAAGILPSNLTDREILLLAHQQLQNVSEEFRSYKLANDLLLQAVGQRIGKIETHMAMAEALKEANATRVRKQVTVIGFIITGINLVVSVLIQFLYRKN